MKTIQTIVLGCAAALTFSACNESTAVRPGPSLADQAYMDKAANSNYAEIQAGNLATTKAENPAIRDFGSQMVSDHTTAQGKLSTIASEGGHPLDPMLDAPHQAAMAQLEALNGRAFDSTYIYMQVKDHEAAIDLMQTIMNSGTWEPLRNYANESLPMIQMHYAHAKELAENLFPR